jgi:hypothetical protein
LCQRNALWLGRHTAQDRTTLIVDPSLAEVTASNKVEDNLEDPNSTGVDEDHRWDRLALSAAAGTEASTVGNAVGDRVVVEREV